MDCRICSQWPTSAISGHFSRERERKTIFSSVRSGAELGQAAVATRWASRNQAAIEARGGGVASGDVAEEAAGGERRPAPRRGRRAWRELLVLLPALPPRRAEAPEGRPPRVSSPSAPPCGLDWNPPDWIVPIRSRRSLIRWRGGMLVVQCDHGGDAEHQHRQVLNGDRAPHQESGETETAFYFRYVPPISRFRGLKIHRIGYLL